MAQKKDRKKHFCQKRKGTAGSGDDYEVDMLILSKIRGERDTDEFYLTTNKNGVGDFDDIVFKYRIKEKSTVILLQAKHTENPKKGKVTIEKFTNPKSNDSNFYLGKYLSAHLRIKEKFNKESEDPVFKGDFQEAKYIIYTNAILDEQFAKNRKIDIDIDNSILSTKTKENKDKAFKFSLCDKNSDLIAMLEKVSYLETIKLLAKAVVSCISGDLNYNNMMGNEFLSTYHVFLARNLIDVGEIKNEITKTKKLKIINIAYREGKINHDFLDIEEDSFKKVLKQEVLYGYAQNVIFKEKRLVLDDVSQRNDLIYKVVESLKSSKIVDGDVIKKLGGTVIILDTGKKQLKFADEEKIQDDKSAIQFIRDLKSKVSKLADYKFDIPYEFVKEILKEQTLKLRVDFGNISPTFKKQEHLIKKLIELFEEYKSSEIIKLDDSVVGHGKNLTDGDIKNLEKLVGNLLVFDEDTRMLKLASEESLDGDARELIKKLKTTALSLGLKVDNYRFDIQIKNFPKDTLFNDAADRTNAEEFLKKLEVFTGQAGDRELKEIIKGEIKNYYDLTEAEIEVNFLKIENRAKEHWKQGEFYLEKDDGIITDISRLNIEFKVKDPVDSFHGRTGELSDLHVRIQRSLKKSSVISRIVSISGLGGTGKTELVRRYVKDQKNYYDGNVIWINAESKTLAEAFRELASDRLSINMIDINGNQKDIKSIVQSVYEFFAKRKSLFIFDNVENSEEFRQFLPRSSSSNNKIYVLVISRIVKEEWEQLGVEERMTLGVFTEEEAVSFVKNALKINSQVNGIRELAVGVLQMFPLALRQAVAHIEEQKRECKLRNWEEYTIAQYLKDYETRKEELLDSKNFKTLDNDYDKTTLTTWKVTAEKIKDDKEYGKLALKIFDMIAYFAPNNILVESYFLKLGKKRKKLWGAVKLLNRYSMIKVDKGEASIHRLVQEVTRINLVYVKKEEETLREILELIKEEDPSYSLSEFGILSNVEVQAVYIWSYAGQYRDLVKDFYSAYGNSRSTPIDLFATCNKIETIRSIIKNTEKDKLMGMVNYFNQAGFAPIHSAAFSGHKDIVKYFIEELGVDVNFSTVGPQITPLFVAILGNQLDVVKYLIEERKVDPNLINKSGLYPIHTAAFLAKKDLLKYLVEKDADILVRAKNFNNVLHFTLFYLKYCRDHPDDIEYIVELFLKKESVLAKGVNSSGITPLHLAAIFGVDRVVKMLLVYGADVNPKHVDKDEYQGKMIHLEPYNKSYTPLHISVKENHLKSVKILLKHGAIYNTINDKRRTPLDDAKPGSDVQNLLTSINESFIAVEKDEKCLLNLLLEGKDSDVLEAILHARNRDGKTLIAVAASNKYENIARFLFVKLKSVQSSD